MRQAPSTDRLDQAMDTIAALQEELARTNHEVLLLTLQLEQRVQERTRELEAANRQLESYSYSIAHDLRAPLRHIRGYIDLLSTDPESRLGDEGRRLMQVIAQSARRMDRLIEDLLEFSRTGRAELRRSTVDTGRLVREVIAELSADLKGRALDWKIADLPVVEADAPMLRQVWMNLLSNAAKFTRQRADAAVEIGCQEHGDELVFFVKDNGVGFDMQHADKLFGVFQRLHAEREFEGTGIGLANVRQIISRHGGRVWAEGRVGYGATFFFSLPRE